MQLWKHQFEKREKQPLVKNNIPNSMVKAKLKNLGHTLHTMGLLSFKTCHRSFSLDIFINIIPCCWALLHYNDTGVPHSVKEISTEQQLAGGREGREKRRGGSAGKGRGGKQKGTWLPPVTAHPRANRGKSITCRIKRKLVHKVKPSESCTHPSKHSLPFLFSSLVIATTPPPPPLWLTPTAVCKF